MSLIGFRTRFDTPHPQDLVDLVYREVFDNHPADSEVDLVLAVRRPDENDEALLEIVDYKLYRVSDPDKEGPGTFRFLATPDDDSWPLSMHKDMIRWGMQMRALHGDSVAIYWLHKHPEGMAYASPKDEVFSDALSSIDFGLGDPSSRRRTYQGGAVVNRYASEPLRVPDSPEPIGDGEVDRGIILRLRAGVIKNHNLPESHPFCVATARQAELLGRGLPNLSPDELRELKRVSLQALMSAPGSPFANLPPEIASMLGGGAPPPPRNIFSLPQFQLPAADNTKPQIGFQPPEDRDRLN